jgi:hypothetical protein
MDYLAEDLQHAQQRRAERRAYVALRLVAAALSDPTKPISARRILSRQAVHRRLNSRP